MDFEDNFSLLEELIPEIPNDVVLDDIVTRLPWNDVYLLSRLSKSWQQAIHRRFVYDARVRCHSTETVIVLRSLIGLSEQIEEVSMYCPRAKSRYRLPPIPGLPKLFELIALDGKLYVLGGMGASEGRFQDMYVLDLAGHRQWEKCASMLKPRIYFACGALSGKIYVFGGIHFNTSNMQDVRVDDMCKAEVYDPKLNAWFPITPMISGRALANVSCVGEELVVHGGCRENFSLVSSWLVYHPLRDQWRVLEPFRIGPVDRIIERVFIWQGKFHSMSSEGIHVHNIEQNFWAHRCAIACDGLGPRNCVRIDPYYILHVDNELLAMVLWKRIDNDTEGWCLLQSAGFATNNREIVWLKAPYSFRFQSKLNGSMCPVRL